ncbi:hypothetical protein [Gemmata sp. SH-PL17]|uniref:hypothetical protein n=1 Tax=Gemmata sp. SH-PL17 TaxID=1630693 RepID=UPI0004B1B3F8|nr:hypothetical protein [Gemmata sp. SH-PL17]
MPHAHLHRREAAEGAVAYIYSFDDDHLLLGGRFPHFNEERPLPDFAYAATFLRLERAKK